MSNDPTPSPAKLTDAELARLADELAGIDVRLEAGERRPTDIDRRRAIFREMDELMTADTYLALIAEVRAAREAEGRQAAFKTYVHKRLDDMGVPTDPDSPHKAEGCRVGGRLDWLKDAAYIIDDLRAELDAARADGERLRDIASSLFEWCGELRESAKHDPHLARFIEEYRAALAPRADGTGETGAGPRGDGTEGGNGK